MMKPVGEGAAGRVGVFGGTGFIGRRVGESFRRDGWNVIVFSRRAAEGRRSSEGELDLSGLDGVVNLAGESVAQRWTAGVRERLRDSRVGLTDRIVEAMAAMPQEDRPGWLVNASAVGYYGGRGEEVLTEEAPPGDGYLAELCRDWEAAADGARELGVRVVLARLGIVLGQEGDAWNRLSRVFRMGGGGVLGDGRQWMPWVHVNDVVGAIRWVIGREEIAGPVNLTAPGLVRNVEFTKLLAARLGRPALFRVPGFALKAVLGGFGATLVASARVVPERLVGAGCRFRFPGLEEALDDLA